jgi:CCR4-NOT transcriptional regulation complex NOT5 subunit
MDSISNKLIDLNSCVNENYLLQKQIEKEIKAKESLREYISLDKVEIANLNKEIKDRVEIEKINNETIIALENDIKYFRKKGNVKLIKGVLIGVTATGLLILGLSL